VFVYSKDANDSFFRSRLDAATRDQVASVDGVSSVAGLSVTQLPVRAPGQAEPDDAAVFAYETANEQVPSPPPAGQAYVDRAFGDTGVEVGGTLQLGPQRTPITVAGWVQDTTFSLQGGIWMDPATWSRVIEANVPAAVLAEGSSQAVLVTIAAGEEPRTVADRIAGQVPSVTALTKEAAILGIPGVADQRSVFTAIITVTFVVAGLVVALFFALLTLERVGLFGVLKAIGTTSRTLAAGLSLQAVLIALAAFVLGGAITLLLAALIPAAIPLQLEPRRALITVLGLMLTALMGSAISFRRIIRIDPATAVGGS
jgi:putative ABC transport system permease protein